MTEIARNGLDNELYFEPCLESGVLIPA